VRFFRTTVDGKSTLEEAPSACAEIGKEKKEKWHSVIVVDVPIFTTPAHAVIFFWRVFFPQSVGGARGQRRERWRLWIPKHWWEKA